MFLSPLGISLEEKGQEMVNKKKKKKQRDYDLRTDIESKEHIPAVKVVTVPQSFTGV